MFRFYSLIIFVLGIGSNMGWAQPIPINDFVVKENLSQNGKLAVVAVDSTQIADDRVQGTYSFSINGFQQSMLFTDGVAVVQQPIESSVLVFFQHNNQLKKIGQLYFVRKTEKGLSTYRISGLVLILIPLVLLFIGYLFKKLKIVVILILVVIFYLKVIKGLELSQIFESFFFSLKSLFF